MKYKLTIQVSSENTQDSSGANPCVIVPASIEIVTPTKFDINFTKVSDQEEAMVIDAFQDRLLLMRLL
jgi:hypothetical protein